MSLDDVSKTFISSLVKFETVVWFGPRYLLSVYECSEE